MMLINIPFLTMCLAAVAAAAAPTATGILPRATYVGYSTSGVDSFMGIPYAVPPVNKNRLKIPQSLKAPLGTVQATGIPHSCPQHGLDSGALPAPLNMSFPTTTSGPSSPSPTASSSEDCLTLNIQRPAGTLPNANLPVLFWIFGGGFEFGSTQEYDGSDLVLKSVEAGEAIMYVAINYRLSGWGFLPGQEVLDAGISNLGMLDQRLSLEWLADNIAAFGGDPAKVTLWGESAGSVSVFNQMTLYNGDNLYKGKPLFRGAIMDSGSIQPTNPVNCPKAQIVYDGVVQAAGCTNSTNTLECLRDLPLSTFQAAIDTFPGLFAYQSSALSFLPRPDGKVLTQSPELLALAGHYTPIPFIIGDQEDEGTLFSLVQTNITTPADLIDYFHTVFFPEAPRSRISALVATYPSAAAAGSPYGTGNANERYPEFKRMAAMIGDFMFTLTRRQLLEIASVRTPEVRTWSYLATYLHGTPYLGTFHGSDIAYAYGESKGFPSESIQSYYVSFVNHLDPNVGGAGNLTEWPEWAGSEHNLLNFSRESNGLVRDDFREASYDFLVNPANPLRQ